MRTVIKNQFWPRAGRAPVETRLVGVVPADAAERGAERQAAHVDNSSSRVDPQKPNAENTTGYAAEFVFSQWARLPMQIWAPGEKDPGYDFVAPGGRVEIKGATKYPWFLPIREDYFLAHAADYYAQAWVTGGRVTFLGWTTHDQAVVDGFWKVIEPPKRHWCVKVIGLNPDMRALRLALRLELI